MSLFRRSQPQPQEKKLWIIIYVGHFITDVYPIFSVTAPDEDEWLQRLAELEEALIGVKGVRSAVGVRGPYPFPKDTVELFYDRLWIVLYRGTIDDDRIDVWPVFSTTRPDQDSWVRHVAANKNGFDLQLDDIRNGVEVRGPFTVIPKLALSTRLAGPVCADDV